MRALLRPSIAVITCSVGIGVTFILRSERPQHLNPPVTVVAELRVSAQRREPEVSPVPEVATKEESGLIIVVTEGGASHKEIPVKLGRDGKATIDLEVGDNIDGHKVTLNLPGSSGSYRMFQRYRTSMSVSAEGPHLDLLDWRHYDSPWVPLKSLGAHHFQTLSSSEMDYSKFPPTTKTEIIQEVRRRVSEDWSGLLVYVKSCSGPNDGACYVSISSIYLRVQKRVGHSWSDVALVELTLPMGC